jgi:hypothetical protein
LFTAFYTNDDGSVTSAHVPLDTQVNYQFADTNGIPITGPGAQARFSYGPNGQVTRILFTASQLASGPSVQIFSASEASNRVAHLAPLNAQISPQLVYWMYFWWPPPPGPGPRPTPPWEIPAPTTVVPWYSFRVTYAVTNPVSGSNYIANLAIPNIPATDDTNFVPSAVLAVRGTTQVVASVSVVGGTPPYLYNWSGSHPDVATNTGPSITYTPAVRVDSPILMVAHTHPTNPIVIWWSPPAMGSFALESTPSLTAPAWSQVTSPVQTNGDGQLTVIVPAITRQQFFRLHLTQLGPMTDILAVTVMDANGVTAQATQTLTVDPIPLPTPADPDPPATYGTESSYDAGGWDVDRAGWQGIMGNSACGGGVQRFCWARYSSWPGDFMEPTPQGALQGPISPAVPGAPGAYAGADYLNWGVNGANMTLYLGTLPIHWGNG